jgi:hypothetical protein
VLEGFPSWGVSNARSIVCRWGEDGDGDIAASDPKTRGMRVDDSVTASFLGCLDDSCGEDQGRQGTNERTKSTFETGLKISVGDED